MVIGTKFTKLSASSKKHPCSPRNESTVISLLTFKISGVLCNLRVVETYGRHWEWHIASYFNSNLGCTLVLDDYFHTLLNIHWISHAFEDLSNLSVYDRLGKTLEGSPHSPTTTFIMGKIWNTIFCFKTAYDMNLFNYWKAFLSLKFILKWNFIH